MGILSDLVSSGRVKPLADPAALGRGIEAIWYAAHAATACADACLAERAVDRLRLCIRLDLDCADVCTATARMLTRQLEPDLAVLRQAVELCLEACRSAADECERHAVLNDACRLCMEACRTAEAACDALLDAIPPEPEEPPAGPDGDGKRH